MALLKVIEWADNSPNTIVYKIDTKNNVINWKRTVCRS